MSERCACGHGVCARATEKPREIVVDRGVWVRSVRPTGSQAVYNLHELLGLTAPTGYHVEFTNGLSIEVHGKVSREMHDACMGRRRFELVLREIG